MATWKKVTLWIVGTVLVMFGGCAALLHRVSADMCATTVIDQLPSPNGKLKAVVFQIDCGATADFNSHVSIVTADTDTSKKDALPKSFFAADGNRGQAPAGKGGPEVRLSWKDGNHLEIQHHHRVRLIRAETISNGVTIGYTTFR
ncbi:MAG: hypothetical protein IPJ27_07990 [Candidatus Accumulibacter sp.]|uniref:Uncharacterized protein n=1 Tax=Candidatus Accumulibacter proximus TaxID=2954385 RepID=A0A935PY92_9PROT|nr:hypothetical protein [Candidatus Accumulibacter proximus]